MTDTRIRVEVIDFGEKWTTVTLVVTDGDLDGEMRIEQEVKLDELSEGTPNRRAAQSVEKAKRRLADSLFRLHEDVDPQAASFRNESVVDVTVARDDRRVQLVSMTRDADNSLAVWFDVNTGNGAMSFNVVPRPVQGAMGEVRTFKEHINPDSLVSDARATLAGVFLRLSSELGDGLVSI